MVKILFICMTFRKFSEIIKTNQFLVSTIFFTIKNISFLSLRFDLFSVITKEVYQIRNNVVCIVARYVFLFAVHSLRAVAMLLNIIS